MIEVPAKLKGNRNTVDQLLFVEYLIIYNLIITTIFSQKKK